MFKIKLLILFLINFLLLGCVINNPDNRQFNVASVKNDKIFLYENTLIQYLDSMKLYNNLDYDYIIEISPDISKELFVTNIDKNSDRKKISLNITYKISKQYKDASLICEIFVQNYNRSSSYIIASGEFNASNKAADEEIFYNLVDIITNDFIDDLIHFKDEGCKYKFV